MQNVRSVAEDIILLLKSLHIYCACLFSYKHAYLASEDIHSAKKEILPIVDIFLSVPIYCFTKQEVIIIS